MIYYKPVENSKVFPLGSGVAPSSLGAMWKRLAPELSIQVFEMRNGLAAQRSNGWDNAGTGHGGICGHGRTPECEIDGFSEISRVIFPLMGASPGAPAFVHILCDLVENRSPQLNEAMEDKVLTEAVISILDEEIRMVESADHDCGTAARPGI